MAVSRETVFDLTSYFGKTPGADRTLIPWDRMREWFSDIERVSPRLTIQPLGKATLGSEMDLLIISSAETIRDLEEIRARRQALTSTERLSDPINADGTLAGTKPVVLITAGIHATEIGGVQLMPELVRDLALEADPEIEAILDRVIILLVPTLNPDGMNLVHEWYERTLGTPSEGVAPPALYHPYAGHDNNRDWYTHALQETRLTIDGVHRPWRPHIVVDLHQMGEFAPRYVVPPYLDPVEPHVHPLINVLSSEVGASAATALLRAGHRGASSGVMFDCYSPTRSYQHYHGGVRILAEAASARIATPVKITPDQVKARRGFDPNLPSVHNPIPWLGGTWRLRDIMDYHLTTIRAVLDHAASHADAWIRDQWTMLADEVRVRRPVTYVIAPLRQQIDPPAARELISTLQRGDVEIGIVNKGTDVFQHMSILVRSNQPFGSYARALLDLTAYPVPRPDENGTRAATPYDVTSHCLPLHLGVDVRRLVGNFDVTTRPLREDDLEVFAPPAARDIDRSRWLAIDARSYLAITPVLNALRNGAQVRRLLRPHIEAGRLLPAGTWLVTDDHAFATMSDAHRQGLRTWLVGPILTGTATQTIPRIGLHVPWKGNAIDAGWARLALEQLECPYEIVRDEDLCSGHLENYDVLVIPHLKEKELLEGNSAKDYPNEFAGGLGEDGVVGITNFANAGGHVVAIDEAASALIPLLHLPVHRPLHDLKRTDFSCPGSILRVIPDPSHPITLGMDESRPVMFADSTAFVLQWEHTGSSPARYAGDNLLLSGWLHGEEHLYGTSAIIDMPVGAGTFTGFGFRPHFRAQMLASYPMLTNALLRSGLLMDQVDQRKS
jgi:hypothetical protein